MDIKAKDGTKVNAFKADEKIWKEEEPVQVGSRYNIYMTIQFTYTKGSLELIVIQFSWHSWIVHTSEFKSSTKTNFERVFLLKLKTNVCTKLHTYE